MQKQENPNLLLIRKLTKYNYLFLFNLKDKYIFFTSNYNINVLLTQLGIKHIKISQNVKIKNDVRIQFIPNKFIKITYNHKRIKINCSDWFFNNLFNLYRYFELEKEIYENLNIEWKIEKNKLHSLGARVEVLIKKTGLYKNYAKLKFNDVLRDIFIGGRMELGYQGVYKGNIYDYDLNSAYGYAFQSIPAFEKINRVNYYAGVHGVYYVKWSLITRFHRFNPFLIKKNGILYGVMKGKGFITGYELDAYTKMYGWKGIKVIYGYVADNIKENDKIRSIVNTLYGLRKKYESKFYNVLLKKMLVILYGKFASQYYKYRNYFLASLITGKIRAELIKIICNRKYENDIIQVMIDGFTSKKRIKLDIGSGIGKWKEQIYKEGVFIKEGVYQLQGKDKHIKHKGLSFSFDLHNFVGKSAMNIDVSYVDSYGLMQSQRIKIDTKPKRIAPNRVPNRLTYLHNYISESFIKKQYDLSKLIQGNVKSMHFVLNQERKPIQILTGKEYLI